MISLALAPPAIAIVWFDLAQATPILPITTRQPGSSYLQSLPKQAFNRPRRQTADPKIPIASDGRPLYTSRGFVPWRFAYAGPSVCRTIIMGPASENLHNSSYRKAAL